MLFRGNVCYWLGLKLESEWGFMGLGLEIGFIRECHYGYILKLGLDRVGFDFSDEEIIRYGILGFNLAGNLIIIISKKEKCL